MKILVIDNRDSFVFNLVQILRESPSAPSFEVKDCDSLADTDMSAYDGILISPGPGIPSEAGMMTEILAGCAGTHSIFGVCLGFQAIVEHFGGTISPMAFPRHGHRSSLRITGCDDPIFRGIPDGTAAGRYHSWKADPENLPMVLEATSFDEDGNIMSVRHRHLPVFGVQFHPESCMTDCGRTMVENWLKVTASVAGRKLKPAARKTKR